MHPEALSCNKDHMRVSLMVKSHFKNEIIEIKPLLYFSESVCIPLSSPYSHSAGEGAEGLMAGKS